MTRLIGTATLPLPAGWLPAAQLLTDQQQSAPRLRLPLALKTLTRRKAVIANSWITLKSIGCPNAASNALR